MTNRQAAIKIIKKLRRNGYKTLLAGGCVRDMLRGTNANDYDVATQAKPDEICRIFRRTIKVGAKFGVIIVLNESQQVEVATFRRENAYTDGRHPTKVKFTSDKEDAMRRDFTVNGMFYDPVKKELIDYVGGQKDIRSKTIRTIGEPLQRFNEDYLRMLRAIRFAAQLEFHIARETMAAIKKNHKNILKISGERICSEIQGMMASENRAKGIKKLRICGLEQTIFPTLKTVPAKFGEKVCGLLPNVVSFPLALAAMFSYCKTKEAMDNCEILKLSRKQRKHLMFLLENKTVLLHENLQLAKLKMLLAGGYFEDLYLLHRAMQKTRKQNCSTLKTIRRRANALAGTNIQPRPLLDGNEIIALGARAGPQVGRIGRKLYTAQLNEKIATVTQAKKMVRNLLKTTKSQTKRNT